MDGQQNIGDALDLRREAAVPRGVATRGLWADAAQGAILTLADGREMIDFAAGIAVVNTGHRHPAVMEAAGAQMARFTHTCFHVAPYEGYVALAERLNAAAPGAFAKRTMLVTTGAEAVENAIKMARAFTGRSGVVAFGGSFHGRTLMGMALTGKQVPYKAGFGAMPPEIHHAPFPDPLGGIDEAEALAALDRLFAGAIDPARVAAMIVEPVQGEGGFNPASPDFLRALRERCDRHGIVMIADEVQTGIARTGALFAMERAGVAADITTLAKGLAGGFPLSAVVARAEIADAAPAGGLGGTYAGNPVAAAAALAVLDTVEAEGLCAAARRIGEAMTARLSALAAEGHGIAEVRGPGAMVAVEFGEGEGSAYRPDPARAGRVIAGCEARGLIVLPCGTRGNAVRLLPPLVVDDATLARAMDIFEAATREAGA
ncbi:aspartate aminotransferase family protein [Jannaschia aquimarina]|uniref:DavT protein n=1 Tax=Jannaschia aquimarina TaxID=935700 RepID=A0A0D1EN36_9RHOB|nr:aminotransferase class III-fold pyridoxal phosphate-dependent enzyme [Jannaschia aquimarina]KIT17115.1 5-aminovalerate aminotransferase DavT [Jannaschia aquimarina]SNS47164.1 4-aminobutyrate aminotransferase apoenzyme [Jannaschia aquimarina]